MKTTKSLIFYFFLLATISGVKSQTTNQRTVEENNPDAPAISFNKMVHDYGTIKKDTNGSCEFVFKNVGKKPLILNNAVASCGCTVPTWPKEPIMPGKTGAIKVVYDTKKAGSFNKTITILSNAQNGPVILTIRGAVKE